MRAALWTKLKAAGPILTFDEEFRRFKPWLPGRLMPLIKQFWLWYQNPPRMNQSPSSRQDNAANTIQAAERLEIEKSALTELYHNAAELRQYPILCQFIERLMDAQKQSLTARQRCLAGQKMNADFDDQLYKHLIMWLEGFRHSKQREIAAWLERLLIAWWLERTHTHDPVARRINTS